jgi:hypothetical protein
MKIYAAGSSSILFNLIVNIIANCFLVVRNSIIIVIAVNFKVISIATVARPLPLRVLLHRSNRQTCGRRCSSSHFESVGACAQIEGGSVVTDLDSGRSRRNHRETDGCRKSFNGP